MFLRRAAYSQLLSFPLRSISHFKHFKTQLYVGGGGGGGGKSNEERKGLFITSSVTLVQRFGQRIFCRSLNKFPSKTNI